MVGEVDGGDRVAVSSCPVMKDATTWIARTAGIVAEAC